MMFRKKRAVTLIEIMIVMLLIGLIGGALAFNMQGSLDQGRAFKTEQNQTRIHDILMLEYARGEDSLEEIAKNWQAIVGRSPLVKNQGRDLLIDGWKKPFVIAPLVAEEDIAVTSEKLMQHRSKHAKTT